MMKLVGDRRFIVDGEVGLKWIAFSGTRGGEGVLREGYYQIWVRITAPEQVTILGRTRKR
jgi:hypothetical protein